MPALWVATDLTHTESCPFDTFVLTTDLPTSLYLLLSPPLPVYSPRYKRVRGIDIPCGYTVTWLDAQCVQQEEQTPGEAHTFHVPSTCESTEQTIAFSECCPPFVGCPATPPFKTHIGGPNDPCAFIQYKSTTLQTFDPITCTWLEWDEVTASCNWPTQALPLHDIVFPTDGLYEVTTSLWWEATAGNKRDVFVHDDTVAAQPIGWVTAQIIGTGVPNYMHGLIWQQRGDIQTINVDQEAATPQDIDSTVAGHASYLTIRLVALGTPNA